MRAEYDFSEGVRGKYAGRFADGTNLVLLDPDVAIEFPTAASVNKSLRELIRTKETARDMTDCTHAASSGGVPLTSRQRLTAVLARA
jgi:hypothetical protein